MKKVLLSVSDLVVRIGGQTLVRDISFDLHKGDILALIGPNGSGKTTVLKALLGLLPSSGQIAWKEKVSIGYVPQRFAFDATFPLTVSELLSLRLKEARFWVHTKKSHQLALDALRSVGAERLAHKRIGALSGGELQRVLLAYALISDPKVLFLDEPVAGIDIEGEETFYNLVKRLSAEKGLTIILVSHDLNIVYKYAAEVMCLNRKMFCFGSPREVLTPEALRETYGEEISGFKHGH
jgi:ABC-type Mn2+/Zn2+ transport system ATPase subunit